MAILICAATILVGMIVYYFEYKPAPKHVPMKEAWKYVTDGIIGECLIIVGCISLILETSIYDIVESSNTFMQVMLLIAILGAAIYLPWIVRIIKRKVIRSKELSAE